MEVKLREQPWQAPPARRQGAGPCGRRKVHTPQDGEQDVISQGAQPIFLLWLAAVAHIILLHGR